ncbi:MAG: hypothetical protein ABRQ39_16930 [Candidatus Eremiobacterota bacterium]
MVKEEKKFKDIFCKKDSCHISPAHEESSAKKPYIPGVKGDVSEHFMVKNIFFEKNPSGAGGIKSEPSEVIERRRYRELKEDFNRKLFNNADRITSVAKPLIISLVVSFVIDLFYWVLAFTPHAGYMWFVGNICTVVQILSGAGLMSLFFYSFFTGRRITMAYDRLFETFDKNLVAELDYL